MAGTPAPPSITEDCEEEESTLEGSNEFNFTSNALIMYVLQLGYSTPESILPQQGGSNDYYFILQTFIFYLNFFR